MRTGVSRSCRAPACEPMQPAAEPMVPAPYQVAARLAESHDCATLQLRPLAAPLPGPRPGQFMMLYAFGVGEVAISLSGLPDGDDGELTHTIRDVGAVSGALHRAGPGTVVGVRGPFGTGWELESAAGRDVVIVGGGVGLAPLRPVILAALAQRSRYRRVIVISGARSPADFLFAREQEEWAGLETIEVCRTIDVPAPGWDGEVGFVTEPLARIRADPARTTAFLCGPEAMMRFCAQTLISKGRAAGRHPGVAGTGHEMRRRPVRALPARRAADLPGRSGGRLRRRRVTAERAGAVT